jgi:hypothetical protein
MLVEVGPEGVGHAVHAFIRPPHRNTTAVPATGSRSISIFDAEFSDIADGEEAIDRGDRLG